MEHVPFHPVFYLPTDMKAYPMDMNTYIEHCQLVDGKNKVVSAELTGLLLGELTRTAPEINDGHHTLVLRNKEHNPLITEYSPDAKTLAENVPIYCLVRQKGPEDVYASYIHCYAVNPSLPVCGIKRWRVGLHLADVEHVTLHFHQGQLKRMYFSRHAGGVWLPPSDLLYEGGQPVVYIARFSHASYNRPGKHKRFCGVLQDVCNKGVRWNPHRIVELHERYNQTRPDLRWVFFRGTLGDGHVANLCLKDFWIDEDEAGPYYAGCCWNWV